MDRSILQPADELLAHWPTSAPVIGIAFTFTGACDLEALRERATERWGELPRLRQRLVPPATKRGRHLWEHGPRFQPGDHIVSSTGPTDFAAWLHRTATQPLPGTAPPWQLHLRSAEGEFTLLLRAHHSLLDGRSLITLLRRLLDAGLTGEETARRSSPRATAPVPRARAIAHGIRSALTPARPVPPPTSPGPHPAYATAEVPLKLFRAAARMLPSHLTTHEIALAATAGALRQLHLTYPPAARRRPVFASLPVDLRNAENADELGNPIANLRVPLPVDVDDPRERLAACQGLVAPFGALDNLKIPLAVLGAACRLGPRMAARVSARGTAASYVAATCTYVPYRSSARTLFGQPLARLHGFPLIPAPGAYCFALCGDTRSYTVNVLSNSLPDDARQMADAFLSQMHTLANADPSDRLGAHGDC
ncbi:wax ester/triacylglycerol synthase domain-containing protein [Streptomyces sp. NPDC050803]|uniref:wax ester/triacylglycerol synthase domain-containing protein n=1 Tax=unclassified Streptomyces TaxID=2593676 RepID=UPI0034458020